MRSDRWAESGQWAREITVRVASTAVSPSRKKKRWSAAAGTPGSVDRREDEGKSSPPFRAPRQGQRLAPLRLNSQPSHRTLPLFFFSSLRSLLPSDCL